MKPKWQTKKIGEIIIEGNKSPLKSRGNKNGSYPFFISGFNIKKIDRYLVDNENIFLPTGGNFFVHYYKGKAAYSTDTWAIKATENVHLKYLYYFLFLNQDFISQKLFKGATIKHLQKNDLKDLDIPLPALSEQKRIVKILDDVFEKIHRSKQKVENNLQNSREFFKSCLDVTFSTIMEKYGEKRICEVATVIRGYTFKSGDFKKKGKYQVIRIGNVRPGIIRQWENPVFISDIEGGVLKRALLLEGDVVITQTGTKNKRDYGFTAIIDKNNYLLNQRISAIRFNNYYLPKFFLYFSWTDYFRDQYFANERGTVGQGNVGIRAVTEATIPFLGLKDQDGVVKRLDQLFENISRLEFLYKQKLQCIEELKKTILTKAFSGDL